MKAQYKTEVIDGFEFEVQDLIFCTNRYCSYLFDNGYGCSIISHTNNDPLAYMKYNSHGNDEKPYEIGFLKTKDNGKGELFTPKGKSSPLIGFLDAVEVREIIEDIKKWEKESM